MTDIEIRHGCGQTMTVTDGELATCPRCRKQVAAFSMTAMTPEQEAFAANLHAPMITHDVDGILLEQVLRRYGELLDAYLSAFRGRLSMEGIPEDLIDAEVSRVRQRWAL